MWKFKKQGGLSIIDPLFYALLTHCAMAGFAMCCHQSKESANGFIGLFSKDQSQAKKIGSGKRASLLSPGLMQEVMGH